MGGNGEEFNSGLTSTKYYECGVTCNKKPFYNEKKLNPLKTMMQICCLFCNPCSTCLFIFTFIVLTFNREPKIRKPKTKQKYKTFKVNFSFYLLSIFLFFFVFFLLQTKYPMIKKPRPETACVCPFVHVLNNI